MKGKTYDLVERKKLWWGEERIQYINESGNFNLIPTCFTDIFERDPFITISKERCDITFDSLMDLKNIIKFLNKQV